MKRSVAVRIHGRVQGVGYRFWTAQKAAELRIEGWVRNRIDGTVEALFFGDTGRVEEMIAACEAGPALARVTRIERRDADPPLEPGFAAFPTV